MEPAIKAGNLQAPEIEDFFSKNIIKVKGGQDIKNCGFGGKCKTKEKRTSRWLDFKTATDLLGGAFRYSAGDIPDYLPQVQIIRSFAKKVTRMEEAIQEGKTDEVQQLFAKSKLDLSRYLPLVELEPLDSQDYTHEWDTRPEVICQGTFCV
ncbi:SEC23 [Symbiodinium sp. CCMP2592]|nr:SEC23 [Symbiodinium sp. CCMP2592]